MKYKLILLIGAAGLIFACRKSEFLNAKPDNSLTVPSSLQDLQAILDFDSYMNGGGNDGVVPAIGEAGTDNTFIPDDQYNSSLYTDQERNLYTWAANPYPGLGLVDWDRPYRAIFESNTCLGLLESIPISSDNENSWNNVKGSALFFRAFHLYELAQVFALPYDSLTAEKDLGIPVRLSSDINEKISRTSVKATYLQILNDLKASIPLLPVVPLYLTRPSKPAAYALLARVFQTMENYQNAYLYADSCLQLDNSLLDYNTLDVNSSFPFARFNQEVLFHCTLIRNLPILIGYTDSLFYNGYDSNDLRKKLFFKFRNGIHTFQGSYDGTGIKFSGIATDEVYLIRAESLARIGDVSSALNDLNTLMVTRWKTGALQPFTAPTADSTLALILQERRKECCFRGLRWTDLRRCNKDPRFAVTLTRQLLGQIYVLPPGDPRYVYPIPDDVISFNPDMVQNKR